MYAEHPLRHRHMDVLTPVLSFATAWRNAGSVHAGVLHGATPLMAGSIA